MDTSAPDGSFRSASCNKPNNYICEINENANFISTGAGLVWYNDFLPSFICHKDDDFRYSFVDYVSSSNYPFAYPNVNDEVIYKT